MSESDDRGAGGNCGAPPGAHAEQGAVELIKAAPGLARVAAVSAWRMASWSVHAGLTGTTYVMRRALEGEAATSIMQDAATDLRAAAWRVLGLDDQHGRPGVPERIQARGRPRPSCKNAAGI